MSIQEHGENMATYKKKTKFGKMIIYYFIIQIILVFLGGLIFTTSTKSPYTDNFKNKWNEAYIKSDNNYIDNTIKKYNIIETNVKKCDEEGFYKKNDNTIFCKGKKKFIFKYDESLESILSKKKNIVITYGIISFILSFAIIFLLLLTNKNLFKGGGTMNSLNIAVRDFVSLIDEIEEYINKKNSRLEYRLESLESLGLAIIKDEPDLFHRFGAKIKELASLAGKNHINDSRDRLYILYKEMEKTFFLKKKMYLRGLGSEISLILSNYNTSLIGFVLNILFFFAISIMILYTIISLNGGNISLIDTAIGVMNVFTFREHGLEINNIYQKFYLVFLQFISYIIFLISIKIIMSKK